MTAPDPRVLIVEDHDLFAQSVVFALRADGVAADRVADLDEDTILAAAADLSPTVVLLDYQLDEEGRTSLPLIKPLRDMGASVVMVTGVSDRLRLAECVEAGALGVVSKAESFDHLVSTIKEVAEMRELMTRAQRDELLAELRRQRAAERERLAPFERLTPREQQVLGALMEGKSAEAIAEDWVVSMATVRSQIRSVLMKLGVNSQLAAVATARQAGWSAPA
jgi:two-component system, NarL family, nitrate/nitrite response regulator NarL